MSPDMSLQGTSGCGHASCLRKSRACSSVAAELTRQAARVKLFARPTFRFAVWLGVSLLWATDAHAQRIPIEAVWSAGVGLFAPFIAVPIKIAVVRLSNVEAASFRPWSLGLVEWAIWFPAAFVILRSSDANLIPVVVPAVLAVSIWFHRSWTVKVSWTIAILLCLITPLLIVALPLLAFGTMVYLQSFAA